MDGRVTSDAFMTATIAALRHGAELHGPSVALFEHDVGLMLSNLARFNGRSPKA